MVVEISNIKSELGVYFAEKKKDDAQKLRTSLSLVSQENPDQVAKVNHLSKATGVPNDLVKLNQDEFERQERVRLDKMKRMVEVSPILSNKLSDPDFAGLSHDDTGNLGNYESKVRELQKNYRLKTVKRLGQSLLHGLVGETFGGGAEGFGMGASSAYNLMEAFPRAFPGILGDIFRIQKKIGIEPDPEKEDPIETAGRKVRELSEEFIKPTGPLSMPEQVAAGLGQAAGQIGLMAIPGGQIPALAMMFGQGVKAQSDKILRDAPDSPEVLQEIEKLTGGFIVGASEFVTNKLLVGLGKAGKVSPEILNLKNKFYGYTAKLALGATSEAIQETMENVFQDIAHIALTSPESKIQFDEAVQSGEIGAWVGGITTAILNGVFHLKGRGFRNSISDLNDAGKAQKLRERSPDDFNGFGGALAKHLADNSSGQVDTLYIDKGAFAQSVTDAGLNPVQVANAIPGIGQQYAEAESTGADIAIRMEDYLGKVAGTEVGDVISPHIRATTESLSYVEQQDIPGIAEEIESQAQEVFEKQSDQKAFEDSALVVEKNIFTQLKDSGNFSNTVNRSYSKFVSNFYVTLADKYGLTPSELYEKLPYKIKGVDEVGFDSAKVLSQAEKTGFEGEIKVEAAEWVQAESKGLDMSEPSRMQRAEEMDFDTSEKWYHGSEEAGFREFKIKDNGKTAGIGIFLTTNKEMASSYATVADEVVFEDLKPGIYETFIKKPSSPAVIDFQGRNWNFPPKNIGKAIGIDFSKNDTVDDIIREIKLKGHDRVTIKNVSDFGRFGGGEQIGQTGDVTVVFDPSEIRTTDAAFDPAFKKSADLLAQRTLEPTETEGFKKWSEGGEIIESFGINDHDFKQDTPVVLKVFHGTTHKFSVFEAEQQGNLEGHYGAINYFTSDEGDAHNNYAGEGPDLTNRIEQRSEQIEQEIEDIGEEQIAELATEHGLDFDPDKETYPEELPREMARAELSGGEDQTMELFVKVKNPFVVGENAEWIEFVDNDEIHELALQEVADNKGITIDEVKENIDDYDEQIDEARWAVEQDSEHSLAEAIRVVSNRHGIDSENLAGEVYDLGESAKPKDIDALLRQSEDYMYVEGEEGGIISSQLVAEVIEEMGFDSIILKDANQQFSNMEIGGGTAHVHIFDSNKTNIKSVENVGTFSPTDPDIFKQDLRGAFDPNQLTTLLHKKADYSTFLHETSHFFLEGYTRLAIEPDAPQDIKDDMKTLLDWFGIDSMEEWAGMDVNEQRKFHEQFASNFEIYLAEGKSPSVEMQGIFDRFAAWLRSIYSNIKNELNVLYKAEFGEDLPILTKELTMVMDRMVSSEEQISQVETLRNMAPIFQNQEEAGMSDEEWKEYNQAEEKAHNTAVRDLQTSTIKQIKWLENAKSRVLKKLQKSAREVRANMRAAVEREVSNQPIYKSIKWLKLGEVSTPGEDVKVNDGNKLDIDDLEGMYKDREGLLGTPDYKKLGYGKFGMLSKEGISPDLVAEMFGFNSGDTLVRSLLDAPPYKEAVEERLDQVMLERYSKLSSPEEMAISVNKAVNNKARAKFVAIELNHLSKATKPARLMNKAAQLAAIQIISSKKLRDIKPHIFNASAAKSARNAELAMKRGDSELASDEKQKQLLSIHLGKEAVKARETVNKSLKLYKKMYKPDIKLGKTRDMNFVSTARSILSHYGIGPQDIPAETYLQNIAQYDPETMAEIGPMIDAHKQKSKNFKEMTFGEFLDMHDQVDALWHLSKRSRQMLIDGQIVERKDVVDQLVSRAEEIGLPAQRKGYTSAMTDWDKRKIMLMGARAALRRVESWVSAMDGADTGVYRKYIWQPISEAVSKFRLAKIDYLNKFMDSVKFIEKGLTGSKIDATEINYVFKDKAELIHAILHTGNSSNKRKLLLGRFWSTENEDGSINTTRWDRFIDRMHREGILTKTDYDFAQSIWELLEGMKPDSQKVHREMYGFYFNEITADPFETPFGEYKGGYIPAVTDPYIVTESAVRIEQETQQTDNSFMFPTTGRGFTKGRVEYNKPLMLDLGYLPAHIDRVLRFTHIEPRIKDVARVVKNSTTFGDALDRLDPTLRGDMLVPWLQRTAQQMVQMPMKGAGGKLIHRLFSELRSRTGMNLMVGNLTNAVQQFTGFSISMVKVKPKNMRNALWTYVTSPLETGTMISEKSDFMKTRMSNYQFEIQKTIEGLLVNPSKYDKLLDFSKRHGYFLQQGFQNVVDTTTWVGAYNQKMEETGDEKESVRFADSSVRETQGSFAPEDISRFETGTAFTRAFTMFYSYFNMGANLLATEFVKTMRKSGLRTGAGRLLYIYTMGFMLPAVLSELLVQGIGGFDVGDDDDDFEMWDAISLFFAAQGRTLAAFVPIVGPATMAGINTWNKKPYDDRMSTSPAVSALEAAVRSPQSVYKAINNDGSWKRATKDFLTTVGLATGLPVGQLGKPIGYLMDVQQGRTRPRSELDFARGLVSGKDVSR